MKILIGICGGISAYKSILLGTKLQKKGVEVFVVLTKTAEKFVGLTTLYTLFPKHVFRHNEQFDDKGNILHTELSKIADKICIAPATANFVSQLAHGQSCNLLLDICLATKNKYIYIAPAMNKYMWKNSLIQKNINILIKHGVHILNPAYGKQACGDIGYGRMLEPEELVDSLVEEGLPTLLKGKRILITLGATHEPLDPMRYIGNYSSGAMGLAFAKMAVQIGAEVTCICGHNQIDTSGLQNVYTVSTALQMYDKVIEYMPKQDIFVSVAAVADYKPKQYYAEKIKKNTDSLSILLIKNLDILAEVKKQFPQVFCIGFSAETNNHEEFGYTKLQKKNMDMIIVNDISTTVNQSDAKVIVIDKENHRINLPKQSKNHIAKNVWKMVEQKLNY